MYSTYNEGKSVVAERFIRTLKKKIFKHITAISKNVYFDVLDDVAKKYNNTVHKTIKMKAIEVKVIIMLKIHKWNCIYRSCTRIKKTLNLKYLK